jgi:hypothetical protein
MNDEKIEFEFEYSMLNIPWKRLYQVSFLIKIFGILSKKA